MSNRTQTVSSVPPFIPSPSLGVPDKLFLPSNPIFLKKGWRKCFLSPLACTSFSKALHSTSPPTPPLNGEFPRDDNFPPPPPPPSLFLLTVFRFLFLRDVDLFFLRLVSSFFLPLLCPRFYLSVAIIMPLIFSPLVSFTVRWFWLLLIRSTSDSLVATHHGWVISDVCVRPPDGMSGTPLSSAHFSLYLVSLDAVTFLD